MPNLRFGRPDPLNFAMLLNEFSDSELPNLTRSTVPLLCYWADYQQRFVEICQHVRCAPPENCDICFEYPVPARGGNTPSYTDIMCVSDSVVIAIEGKSTEPKDTKTVGNWLGPAPSQNKMSVLMGWLESIGQVTRLVVDGADFNPFHQLTYQMIHRTASACSFNANRTAVVYQVFDIGKPRCQPADYYSGALEALANAIGAAGNLDILLHYVKAERTEKYRRTQYRIGEAPPNQIPGIIRRAINGGGLFNFPNGSWTPISKSNPNDVGA